MKSRIFLAFAIGLGVGFFSVITVHGQFDVGKDESATKPAVQKSAIEQGNDNLAEEESEKRTAATLLNQAKIFPSHRFVLTEMHYDDFGTRKDGTEWVVFRAAYPFGPELHKPLPPRTAQVSQTILQVSIERTSKDKEWHLVAVTEAYSVLGILWSAEK